MKPSDLSHRVGGCALGAIISVISLNSWAEPELSVAVGGPTLTDSTVAQAKGLGVTLSVHSESTELVAEDLRAAIARELDEVVVLGESSANDEGSRSIVVTYHPGTRELAVSVTHPGRANTTRVVEAPHALDEVVTVVSLLAHELLREPVGDVKVVPSPAGAPQQPVLAVLPLPVLPPKTLPPIDHPPKSVFATASFFYPLATNYDKPSVRTHFSFNALYGHVGSLDGFELGLLNVESKEGRGVQIGGLGNWIGGSFNGLQVGGIGNASQSIQGLQLSFGVNHVRDTSLGGNIAGIANVTGAKANGVSIALGVNSAQTSEGFAVAGLTNITRGNVTGVELAAFNYAKDVSGVQVGVINVAGKVSGMQLGLVNIADDVDGVPIGLISVTRSGGIHPQFWASSASLANVGLKFATRYTYTLLNVSAKPVDNHWRVGPGLAFGVSVPVLPKTFFEPDLGVTHLIGKTSCCTTGPLGAVERQRDETLTRLRGALRYEFIRHFSLFAGAGVVGRLTYSLNHGDTKYLLDGLLEGFGGVEL